MKSYVYLFTFLILIASGCVFDDEIMEEELEEMEEEIMEEEMEEESNCNCLDECASNYNPESTDYDDCFYGDKFHPKNYSTFSNFNDGGIFGNLQLASSGGLEFTKRTIIDEGCKSIIYDLTVISKKGEKILNTELTSSGPYLRLPNNIMKFDSVYYKDDDVPHEVVCQGVWSHMLCDEIFDWHAYCDCLVTNLNDGITTQDSIEFYLIQ